MHCRIQNPCSVKPTDNIVEQSLEALEEQEKHPQKGP